MDPGSNRLGAVRCNITYHIRVGVTPVELCELSYVVFLDEH